MVANDLCIKAKAECGTVKQLSFSGLNCSGLHSFLGASGSVVECLTRDRGAAVPSLKGVTAQDI